MRLYSTLTGREEEFSPAGDTVKMYVCGITPYAPCHMGHAMSYVIFDVLRRYLEYIGYQVQHVQNFTDIDDKIIQRAQEQNVGHQELAEKYIEEFMENMEALNVKSANLYPRATREIPQILEVIGSLIEKGYAYASDGDVYFRVTKSSDYGKLSHRTLEGMIAGARVEVEAGKEHPMDFALWKAAKAGEPAWDSPWGPGRPGWHIECTAMSMSYLGDALDIHGGGQDLVFPHHENETAQSEAYSGTVPFARYWVHNGLLHMGEDKMSKSLGNLVSLEEVLKTHSPDALRIFFLSSHYRSPLNYSEDSHVSTERAAERLRNTLREGPANDTDTLGPEPYKQAFIQAMDSDLNTPQALGAIFDLAREINRAREAGRGVAQAQGTLRELGGVLGLTFSQPGEARGESATPFIDLLVDTRTELRAARQYALADQIRDRLAGLGVVLEDTPQGTSWRYGG
jgi:cysteinyl-tRNA synthetase